MKKILTPVSPQTDVQVRRNWNDGHGDHPLDRFLKPGRIPHIWCSGCGIGIVFAAFVKALESSGIDLENTAVVSGIGCSGRAAGYLNLDTYHTTHGRAIPFATGLKLANPKLNVIVFSGDGDLFAIGGNHMIHAARRNVDLTVICINNFNYGMTGGQGGPTTPLEAKTTTTPYGCAEHPFNLVYLAKAAGAIYVSRWTVLHTYELRDAIVEAIKKPGFSFVEAVAPCHTGYVRRNKLGTALDLMRFYRENSFRTDVLDPENTALPFEGKVAVGTFVDAQKKTFLEMYRESVVTRAEAGREPETATPVLPASTEGGRSTAQVRLAGFGGQGIVLAGLILGKTATLFEGANATMTQSYGPEARGGACSADVIISSARIDYPRVIQPQFLVLMSEEAARTYGETAAVDALVLVNEDLVKSAPKRPDLNVRTIPATGIAEKLGRVIVANIVMLGFLCSASGVVGYDALKQSILASIPEGTEKLNIAAFQAGFDWGRTE